MYNYPYWGPPTWTYPPQPPPVNPTDMTPKEFRRWLQIHKDWEELVGSKKKDEKEKKEEKKKMFHTLEVFLIMMGTSPFIYLLYKSVIIPQLLR